ncbi:hypothetical protein CEP53_009864 [Fusarium sp. AF-6]|nr:hypothetical protein CEP53_009864 [Fusarium sp. AF-6]
MAENRDIAFCFRGWAYDTGKVDRPKRRVIRISRAHDCRRAKDILSLNDTTDAGLVISPKEEDIEGVDCGLLAVIVGELLPQAEVPNHKEFSKPVPLQSFDPAIHTFVETRPQTRLVVAIIRQQRCTLHLLHSKRRDGLCEATPLPGQQACNDRVVYY